MAIELLGRKMVVCSEFCGNLEDKTWNNEDESDLACEVSEV